MPDMLSQTPAERGFRMPAEWGEHAATWIGWPHNRRDWPGKLAAGYWVYAEIVRKIVPGEKVHILVNSESHEALARRYLRRAGAGLAGVSFFHFHTNRSWTRDYGPMFIKRDGPRPEIAIARFEIG